MYSEGGLCELIEVVANPGRKSLPSFIAFRGLEAQADPVAKLVPDSQPNNPFIHNRLRSFLIGSIDPVSAPRYLVPALAGRKRLTFSRLAGVRESRSVSLRHE